MPTNYQTEGYVVLTGVTFSGTEGAAGSSLTWTGVSTFSDGDSNYPIIDNDDDGRLDEGADDFGTFTINFTGYTITVGGVEYGVFVDSSNYAVPLPQDGSTQTLIPSSGTSNVYQAETSDTGVFFCFATGTRIATPVGEVEVETLKIGDRLLTATGEALVKWIGRQTLRKRQYGPHMQPVRIRAGALGGGLPHSDLTVTADHGMVLDALVINASALVNGDTIDFVPLDELEDSFTVYHIETKDHDVILANGAPAETFVDAVTRSHFDNYQEYLDLYGAERIIREMPLPRIASARLVPQSIKHRLSVSAGEGLQRTA